MSDIVIVIRGGVLQNVSCSDKDAIVQVVDYDDAMEDSTTDVAELTEKQAIENLHKVY